MLVRHGGVKCLGLLVACLVVSACGSSGRPVRTDHPRPLRLVPPSPTAFRFSTKSNRDFARENVREILRIVVLPSSARALTKAPPGAPRWIRNQLAQPGTSASHGMVQARGIWLVPERLGQVMRFVRSHARPRPRPLVPFRLNSGEIGSRTSGDYLFPPVPGRSSSRELFLTLTPGRGGSTIVFAQAQETWNHASPRYAVLPSRVKRIDITSGYGGQPRSVLVHVRSPFEVGSILAWTNGLGLATNVICFGYMGGGPAVTLTFRSASGKVLARAQVSNVDGSGFSGACNPLVLTIGSRTPVRLIGADLLLRLQRMLGIDLAPASPSVVSSCLRRGGWVVHTHHGPPVQVVARHRGRRWTITFPLTGKVTTNGPPAPALARCLRTPSFARYG